MALRRRLHHRVALHLQHPRQRALAVRLRRKQQNPRRPFHFDHALQQIIFRQGVVGRLDQQLVTVIAALGQTIAKTEKIAAGFQTHLLLGMQRAVAQQANARRRFTPAFHRGANFKPFGAVYLARQS